MTYINNYIKERYHADEEFRKDYINNIRTYQKTEKGKETLKRAISNFKRKNPHYFAEIMIRKREEARKDHICTHCFKNKARRGKHECTQCADHRKELWRMMHGKA